MRKAFVIMAACAICALALFANIGFAQWFGGFHRGGHGMGLDAQYDGHRYLYANPAADTLVSGTIIADSTYHLMTNYKLDTNNDNMGDFYLDFGPWWYRPDSVARPVDGDSATIKGSIFPLSGDIEIIVVRELNGTAWKSFGGGLGMGWSGNWMRGGIVADQFVFNPMDSLSFVRFGGNFMGHMGGQMGGGMAVPDSFFCDFSEIPYELMPHLGNDSMAYGYHFDFLDDNWRSMMTGSYSWGRGMMGFNNSVGFTMHYNPFHLDSLGIDPHDLMVKYWRESDSSWVEMGMANIDQNANTISFSTTTSSAYYAVVYPANVTSVGEPVAAGPDGYQLSQNYPNPFNASTVIRFQVPQPSHVVIEIYSISGQLVATITDREYTAGQHSVVWSGIDANNISVASGAYFYKIKSGEFEVSKKMLYLK